MKTRWITKLINACAVLLIVASLFVLLTVVITPPGEVPKIMGFSMFQVATGSMRPEIPERTVLLVRETDPNGIVPGDVITFFSPDPDLDGAPVTHRVLEVQRQNGALQFVTKGDANQIADTYPVGSERLIGKVVFTSAALGVLMSLLGNRLVFGLLVVLPILSILLYNLVRSIRMAIALARKEEEAAVRQAIDEIQAKRAAEAEKDDANHINSEDGIEAPPDTKSK